MKEIISIIMVSALSFAAFVIIEHLKDKSEANNNIHSILINCNGENIHTEENAYVNEAYIDKEGAHVMWSNGAKTFITDISSDYKCKIISITSPSEYSGS